MAARVVTTEQKNLYSFRGFDSPPGRKPYFMTIFTDESIMPFGLYKGKKMANVPAHHLLWVYDQPWCRGPVKQYIEDNMELLKKGK